jgi:YVTN family beta-propeller protein
MKKFIFSLMILFSYLEAANLALIPGDSDVTVINMDTLTTVTTIPVQANAGFIAISPDNKKAVVSGGSGLSTSITVIDLTTFLTTNISGAQFSFPANVFITPDSSKAFICNRGAANPGTISVIDLTTSPPAFIKNVNVGSSPGGNGGYQPMTITPDGSLAFVTNAFNASVTPIDIATLTPLTDIQLGAGAVPIAIACIDNNTVLAASAGIDAVTPINIATLTTLTSIPLPAGAVPLSMAIDHLNNRAFIADNSANKVTPIDLATLTPLTNILFDGSSNTRFIGITLDNSMLFTVNQDNNSVTPIDPVTLTALTNITVGTAPQYCAFTSDKVLVVNAVSNNVTPIDLATLAPLTNISVGSFPIQAAIFSSSPLNFSGKREVVKALFQKDLINELSWSAPVTGTPAFYKIFRNSALTDLVATLNGNVTTYNDHDRKYRVVYTYFLVAFDANGNASAPAFLSFP